MPMPFVQWMIVALPASNAWGQKSVRPLPGGFMLWITALQSFLRAQAGRQFASQSPRCYLLSVRLALLLEDQQNWSAYHEKHQVITVQFLQFESAAMRK
jgi:hypothetical protein